MSKEMEFYLKNKDYLKLFKTLISAVSHRIDAFILTLLRCIPVDNDMLVLQSDGDFWDNTRVFYDYLIEKGFNNSHKIIWLVKDPKLYKAPKNVKFVKRTSMFPVFKTDYYLSKAKCVIYTHSIPNPLKKRFWKKEQCFINTTHSASQLKQVETHLKDNSNYKLCCGQDGLIKRSKAWGLEEAHFPIIGMPRLDLLFKHKDCMSILIDDYNGERIILSMETFKTGIRHQDTKDSTDKYAINVVNSPKELLELDAFLKQNGAYMIVKIHHMQVLDFLDFVKLDRIKFITDQNLVERNIQLYELIENADIMLTDYSSVFYDYLLLDRPIGFMIGDIDQYSRGFISDDPLNEMPGEIIKKLPELLAFLEDAMNGNDKYHTNRKNCLDLVFKYHDDKNCERLFNWLKQNKFIS